MRVCSAILLLVWIGATVKCAPAQSSFAFEPAGAPRLEVPIPLRNMLEPSGTRLLHIVNGVGVPICELWWSKTVPTRSRARERHDIAYGQLISGSLLGVLYLPSPQLDFKEHTLGPGFYTMRYAKLRKEKENEKKEKEDDEQEGSIRTSHYRDFVLLSHLESDNQVGAQLRLAHLLKLSKQTSHSDEPAMLSLVPVNTIYKGLPSLVSDDQGNCTLQVKLQARASRSRTKELDLAIVLVNPPNVSRDD